VCGGVEIGMLCVVLEAGSALLYSVWVALGKTWLARRYESLYGVEDYVLCLLCSYIFTLQSVICAHPFRSRRLSHLTPLLPPCLAIVFQLCTTLHYSRVSIIPFPLKCLLLASTFPPVSHW
jgi:hypothetical protein